MDDQNTTSTGGLKRTLAAAVVVAVCLGGLIGYFLYRYRLAGGSLEISFKINDPRRYPDDEPLSTPQTVVWLEDATGDYVRSLLVSDWTSGEGWKVKVKLPGGRKVKKICPQWQVASNWPEKHSKQIIDAVTKATPKTGAHTVSIKCRDLKLSVGTYRYRVQTSVATRHTIICTGTIDIGGGSTETQAEIVYHPEMHEDAGPVLSNVTARYTP